MATIEQPRDRVNAITRSRSARLADQAATAALYVTRPDRRLSVREPAAAETQLFKDTKPTPHLSHASAGAVLAHAKSKPFEIWRPGKLPAAEKAAYHVQDYRAPEISLTSESSPEGYKAAMSAIRDRRASAALNQDASATDQTAADGSRRPSEHDKAILAATGAFRSNRQRADSSPSKPTAQYDAPNITSATEEEPLEHLDSANEASRIHHIANANARLYTASPPVAVETEEQNKKNVLRAAAVSMARDMYNIAESRDAQTPGAAVSAAQKGHSRTRSQRSVTKPDPSALQRAMSLQEAAQKRAAEKLALMHDETAAYQNYYGTGPQAAARSSLVRKRRTSVDTDISNFDVERSVEIRNQMSSLRTKVNAVDEQRQRDRLLLMEAARRNVDAAIHDMELRVYAETGRAPPSKQKEWEDAAYEHAQRELQEIESQYTAPDRVNIGAEQYMDMADVQAVARSRVQPTIDEITDRADQQRAKDLEARLDEDERKRREDIERQREADTRAEEKRQIEAEKQEAKEKEEKSRLWRRKSKRSRDKEAPVEKDGAPDGHVVGEPEQPSAETTLPEAVEEDNAVAASGAAAADLNAASPPTSPRTESKLRNWFRGRLGRRSSANARETLGETEEENGRVPSFAGGAALANVNDSRGAALSSHPITGTDLNEMQRASFGEGGGLEQARTTEDQVGQQATKEKSGTNGEQRRSRLRSSFMKIVSKNSQEPKTNGTSGQENTSRRGSKAVEGAEHGPPDVQRSTAAEREDLRESATEQGLPVPPDMAKRTSNSTARGSRFSEDL